MRRSQGETCSVMHDSSPSCYMDVPTDEVREASRARARLLRASASPMPGEHRGELHASERRDMDGSAGPERSRDSAASAV
jgi:hypothetical protein